MCCISIHDYRKEITTTFRAFSPSGNLPDHHGFKPRQNVSVMLDLYIQELNSNEGKRGVDYEDLGDSGEAGGDDADDDGGSLSDSDSSLSGAGRNVTKETIRGTYQLPSDNPACFGEGQNTSMAKVCR